MIFKLWRASKHNYKTAVSVEIGSLAELLELSEKEGQALVIEKRADEPGVWEICIYDDHLE